MWIYIFSLSIILCLCFTWTYKTFAVHVVTVLLFPLTSFILFLLVVSICAALTECRKKEFSLSFMFAFFLFGLYFVCLLLLFFCTYYIIEQMRTTHNIPAEMENLFVLYNKTHIKKTGNNHKQQITNISAEEVWEKSGSKSVRIQHQNRVNIRSKICM